MTDTHPAICPGCCRPAGDTDRFCRYCGFRLDGALFHDIILNFQSVSTPDGHFGNETKYLHGERRVVYSKWGTGLERTSEYLDVPDEIRTEPDLREYVRIVNPIWMFR